MSTADVIDAPMAHHLAGKSYTRSGYGSRLPLCGKVRVDGRLYRMYCDCWGNAPSGPYIVRKGTIVWLDLT